jgi:hypothetical protein
MIWHRWDRSLAAVGVVVAALCGAGQSLITTRVVAGATKQLPVVAAVVATASVAASVAAGR